MNEESNTTARKQILTPLEIIHPKELNGSILDAINVLTEYKNIFGPNVVLDYGLYDTSADVRTINISSVREETDEEYNIRLFDDGVNALLCGKCRF
jgi:hypothetical protein